MKYRTLGKTGFKVSEIGYGTWAIAGDDNFWSVPEPKQIIKNFYRYTEMGGNFIDTAYVYGWDGKDSHPSEELIGRFIRESGKRDGVIIATKIPPKNMKWPAWKGVGIDEVFPSQHIEKCVDESLKSLGIDTIDLMQFHVWQDDFVDRDEWKETIQKIAKAGKVKHWGISVNDYQPSNCLRTLDTGLIDTIQFIFNVFHQKPIEKLLPYAKENNIGLIARVPLDEGGLGEEIDEIMDENVYPRKFFPGDRLIELKKHRAELDKLLGNEAKTIAELALRFILSHEAVSTTIPGMRQIKHVEDNVKVSDGNNLSQELLEELKKCAWERNFYNQFVDPSMKDTNYIEE